MVRKKKPALATKQDMPQGNTEAFRGDVWILKEAVQTMNGNIRLLKGDIQLARGDLQKLEERIDTKMDAKFEKFAETITQHMNVVAENLVHDFKGIFKDRLEQHEDRIICLEKHVGLTRV